MEQIQNRNEREIRLSFRVQGEPVPMPRPRTVTKGGKTWTFSGNKASRDYQKAIKLAGMAASVTTHHFDSAILRIILSTEKKCDVDNVAKSIMDALTGVLWDNDKVIWQLTVVRMDGMCIEVPPYTNIEVVGTEPPHKQQSII